MIKPGKAVHNCPTPVLREGKFVTMIDRREVRVMAVAEGYAMVRRPKCFPYVCPVKELAQ